MSINVYLKICDMDIFVQKFDGSVVRARCQHCVHFSYSDRKFGLPSWGSCDLKACKLFKTTLSCDGFCPKKYFKLFDTFQLNLF